MNDIEKRARELLIAEYKTRGELVHAMNIERGGLSLMYGAEIAAIIVALTPPDGYVLVPVEPTEAMIDAVESIKMPHALLRTGVRIADFHERYQAMLTARPEEI